MDKSTYYLWISEETDLEELEREKMYWKKLGFRVAVFIDGDNNKDINEGLKAVIRNHTSSEN